MLPPHRILLVTFGSRGDVHPFLAVAAALRERGAEAIVAAPRMHEAAVRGASVRYVEAFRATDLSGLLGGERVLARRGGRMTIYGAIAEGVPAHVAELRALLRGERIDCVLTHPFALGTAWASEEEGVPWGTVALSPMAWYARTDPVPLVQRRPGRLRFIAGRAVDRMMRRSVRWVGSAMLNPLRRRCGLPAWRRCFERTIHGGRINLGLWSPRFRGPGGKDPADSQIVGFARWDEAQRGLEGSSGRGAEEATVPSGAAIRDRGGERPRLVVSLGSTAVHVGGPIFAAAVAAIERLGWSALVLAGSGAGAVGTRSGSIRVEPYAPLAECLVGADLFIHHGGIGSIAEALHAGVPSVAIPHAFDQHHNALHLVRLGLGAMLSRREVNADRLAALLRRIAEDRGFAERASEFARQIRREDGAAAAAEAALRLARQPRSPR
ncbi:MAG TPA: glycosyltransferase [Phycisphaerales bacterium]|nr:glycosyltransferase [Phycisphaerales bacterium]HMP37227.1 glycosyltransferase [Phycisphaerales bacterium]